jgi:hypothetical protein
VDCNFTFLDAPKDQYPTNADLVGVFLGISRRVVERLLWLLTSTKAALTPS